MPSRNLPAAILKGKCPRCRQGEMFPYSAWNLARFNKMNEHCPHCGVRLEPEPGFYQGAMYVSYAFTIFFMVAISLLLYVTIQPGEWGYIFSVIGVMIVLIPFNYRYSRIVYLYCFGGIRYDRQLSAK